MNTYRRDHVSCSYVFGIWCKIICKEYWRPLFVFQKCTISREAAHVEFCQRPFESHCRGNVNRFCPENRIWRRFRLDIQSNSWVWIVFCGTIIALGTIGTILSIKFYQSSIFLVVLRLQLMERQSDVSWWSSSLKIGTNFSNFLYSREDTFIGYCVKKDGQWIRHGRS